MVTLISSIQTNLQFKVTLKESGEDCFKVFLENRNVNYIGFQNSPISVWYEVGQRLNDWEGGFYTASVAKLRRSQ